MKKFKTPNHVQFQSTECGAVSLYILLGYYGKWINLEEIRLRCKVGRDGANLANTAKAAEFFGLDVTLYKYTAEELRSEFSAPCIVFFNKNHFLVVEGFSNNTVFLSDPARGRRSCDFDEFKQSFSQFCLFASPNDSFVRVGTPPSEKRQFIDIINSKNLPAIYLSFALGIVTTVPTVGLSAISIFFTQTVIENIKNSNNGYIWILLFFTFMLLLSSELMYMIQRRLQVYVNTDVLDKFFNKLFAMPLSFYSQRDMGELSDRITIASKISTTLTGPFSSAIIGLTQVVVYSIALLFFNVGLTILVSTSFVLIVIFSLNFLDKVGQLSQRSSISRGKLASALLYMTSNSEQIKGNGLEGELFSEWSDNFTEFTNASSQVSLISQYASAGTSFLKNLANYLVILVGGWLIISGDLSMAGFIGLRILTQGIFSPLSSATSFISAAKGLSGELNRLFDVFENPDDDIYESIIDSQNSSFISPNKHEYLSSVLNIDNNSNLLSQSRTFDNTQIVLSGVNYSFPGSASVCLNNIDILIPDGSITAVCGPSGCGKSTLLRLMSGLCHPDDGSITVGDEPLNLNMIADYLSCVAYIDTNIFIMNASVCDNVTLYDPMYSRTDVIEALEKAQIFDAVKKLPNSIDYVLQADGSDLSGGQKQRIQLARAFLRKPLITFLDEGTSALDNETERKVLIELCKTSNTLIASTHRPSMFAISNQIILLSSTGSIDAFGTYKELVATSSNFRNLFSIDSNQFS